MNKPIPRIRIISNGRGVGTRVLDLATGEDLTDALMLRGIKWEIGEGERIARATLECYAQLEVEAEAEVIQCELPFPGRENE